MRTVRMCDESENENELCSLVLAVSQVPRRSGRSRVAATPVDVNEMHPLLHEQAGRVMTEQTSSQGITPRCSPLLSMHVGMSDQ